MLALPLLIASPSSAYAAQAGLSVVHSFGQTNQMGENPSCTLLVSRDGLCYGTTESGGAARHGVVFRMGKDGAGYQVLHHFGATTNDGRKPVAGLVEDADGYLFGTTYSGGSNASGTVFRLDREGNSYRLLRLFNGGTDGANPRAALLVGSDGVLYGSTEYGGDHNSGILFKLNRDGTGYTVLRSFGANSRDGVSPYADLVEGADGLLYGTTFWGGQNGWGTVFQLTRSGGSYTTLHSFDGEAAGDGAMPAAGLIEGQDGVLYGLTSAGGTNNVGTVFRLAKNGGGYAVILHFQDNDLDGQSPAAALVQASNGVLYGVTEMGGAAGGGSVFQLATNGSHYVVLVSLGTAAGDGRSPRAALVADSTGFLLGTTYLGGIAEVGAVFALDPAHTNCTVRWSFLRGGGDGLSPTAGLVTDRTGTLYGATCYGGAADAGTIFKADRGDIAVFHHFGVVPGDAKYPRATLVRSPDGLFYGTTEAGGDMDAGTAFKISAAGSTYTVIRSFGTNAGDGKVPKAALLAARDGLLYGTTERGGAVDAGTVYRLSPEGNTYAVLKSFGTTPDDGSNSVAALVEAANGRLVGTTRAGGSQAAGTVFSLSADGSDYTILRNFGAPGDGKAPAAAVLSASDGWLYGTTELGGAYGLGCIFRLRPDGSDYTLVRSFGYPVGDGKKPAAALVEAPDARLYGATFQGGQYGYGTVFRLARAGDGSGYEVLWSFSGTGGSGRTPFASLTPGVDGGLYTTTSAGGSLGYGSIVHLVVPSLTVLFNPRWTANGFSVTFHTVSNVTYTPQCKNALADLQWLPMSDLIGTGETMSLSDTNPVASSRVYRVLSR